MAETVSGEVIQILDANEIGRYSVPDDVETLVRHYDGHLVVIQTRDRTRQEQMRSCFSVPVRPSPDWIADVVFIDADFEVGDTVELAVEPHNEHFYVGENIHVVQERMASLDDSGGHIDIEDVHPRVRSGRADTILQMRLPAIIEAARQEAVQEVCGEFEEIVEAAETMKDLEGCLYANGLRENADGKA